MADGECRSSRNPVELTSASLAVALKHSVGVSVGMPCQIFRHYFGSLFCCLPHCCHTVTRTNSSVIRRIHFITSVITTEETRPLRNDSVIKIKETDTAAASVSTNKKNNNPKHSARHQSVWRRCHRLLTTGDPARHSLTASLMSTEKRKPFERKVSTFRIININQSY